MGPEHVSEIERRRCISQIAFHQNSVEALGFGNISKLLSRLSPRKQVIGIVLRLADRKEKLAVFVSTSPRLFDFETAARNALLANYEKEQAREAMREAARQLTRWIIHNGELTERISRHVHDSLISTTASAHPQTINAAITREGNWHKLNYGHNLSHGARRMAAQAAERKLVSFREIAKHLLLDEKLTDAHDLVRQALRALEAGFDSLIRKVQLVGQSIHADELSADADFWRDCEREWGRGSGYRDRVNTHNKERFEEKRGREADHRVLAGIHEEWKNAIASVAQLLPEPGEEGAKDAAA
jgi:hypothetical protein